MNVERQEGKPRHQVLTAFLSFSVKGCGDIGGWILGVGALCLFFKTGNINTTFFYADRNDH